MHLVFTVAALWFREFRHRFHPIFTERFFTLCEIKGKLEVKLEEIMTEDDTTRKHSD